MASPEQIPLAIDNAVRTAIATSAPTCVILPHDVQRAPVPGATAPAHGVVPTSTVVGHPQVVPQDADLDRAVAVLTSATRSALLVGQGAAGAGAEVVELADRLGAGITVSLLGKPPRTARP